MKTKKAIKIFKSEPATPWNVEKELALRHLIAIAEKACEEEVMYDSLNKYDITDDYGEAKEGLCFDLLKYLGVEL